MITNKTIPILTLPASLAARIVVGALFTCLAFATAVSPLAAQKLPAAKGVSESSDVKTGHLIDAPLPLDSDSADTMVAKLTRLAESASSGQRITVVIRYRTGKDEGQGTEFEDAMKVARAITQSGLKIVSFVETRVIGHSTLPILVSESLVVTDNAVIGNVRAGDRYVDGSDMVNYPFQAKKRGLFPPAIVKAMVDPDLELALVTTDDREQVFATGDELTKLRDSGRRSGEDLWSQRGVPLELTAKQLRDAKITAPPVVSLEEALDIWDLASVDSLDETQFDGESVGTLLEIAGSVSSGRVRRWQSNLDGSLRDGDVNTWVISIDSGGGDIDQSATMAGMFTDPQPPLRTVAGYVQGEARGDSALIALACDPLYMAPGATLGGPGSDVVTDIDLQNYDDLIVQIANSTNRPEWLIRGLLNRDLVVYKYTHKTNGRVKYVTEDGLTDGVEDPINERERWQRGDAVELAAGLSAEQALDLGLIDGDARTLEDVSRRVGLPGTPETLTDRGIVRFVEKLGRSQALAFMLLFIGFVTLSAEANAPGMSVPGFISVVCFALYFWIKFLAGTAEWLELILFVVGLICIAIELFVIPGFGVFGVGGLAMTILGLVLMSQTFVIPKNTYQIEVLTKGLWIALGGAFGLIGGFIAMRLMFPHIPLFKGLVMEAPDASVVEQAERLAHYDYLAGQTGMTTTPLMPSGKARFGDTVVAVVSDGSAVPTAAAVRVVEVQGNRVVVEAVNG